MKFKQLSLALLVGTIFPLVSANAAKVANLGVTGTTDYLNILWDQLSSSDFDNADGYAVQWSDREPDVKITKSIDQYTNGNVDDLNLRRNSFNNDTYYYLRVYTYKVDDNNKRVLGNGSDMLKFKITFENEVTSEKITVTDPVVDTNSGSTLDTSDFDFGTLRKYPYDTFADLFWSRPREMTTSDYDNFMIVISENSDMSDPILEEKINRDATSVRVTGLTPNKTYYAQGHFHKNTNTFGESSIRSFKTIEAIPRDNSTRQSRNIVKVENRAIRKVSIDGSSTTTTSSATTSSTSTSSSTTVSTSSQSTIDSADQTAVRNKVNDLKRQISALQSELRRWEAKLEGGSTTSTRTSSSSNTRSSSGLSVRERLKLILEQRRQNK